MNELSFLLGMAGFCIHFIVHAAFYFAAFRRVFCPPGGNSLLPTVLFLVFFNLGFPVVFIAGWIKSRSQALTQVMISWTLSLVVTVVAMAVVINLSDEQGGAIVLAGAAAIVAVLALRTLIPFFRLEDRIRSLVRDPSEQHIARVVALGPVVMPQLKQLLANQYAPTREAAVACLARMGPDAVSLLRSATSDEDADVRAAAQAAMERVQQSSQAP